MKKYTLLIIVIVSALCGTTLGQSLEQQYGQADAELNRVYNEIRSKLTDHSKKELQAIQKNWIAERDTAANSATSRDQKYKILTTKTIDRTTALKNILSAAEKDAKNVPKLHHISPDVDEQYKQADKELNQVYKSLIATLSEEEYKQLKASQREWIKQRDAFVARHPENPNKALLFWTTQRVDALREIMNQTRNDNSRYSLLIERVISNPDFSRMGRGCNEFLKQYCKIENVEKSKEISVQINSAHSEDPVAAAISKNELLVATGTLQGDIIIWDLKTGRVCRNLNIGMRLGGIRFASENVILAIGGEFKTGEQYIKFFDIINGKQIGATLNGMTGGDNNYANAYRPSDFSAESGLVAGIGADKTLEVTGWSNYSSNTTPINNDLEHITIRVPMLADLEYPIKCSFTDHGRKIHVQVSKYDIHRNEIPDLGYPWRTSFVKSKCVGSIIYDTTTKKWEPMNRYTDGPKSLVLAHSNNTKIINKNGDLIFSKNNQEQIEICNNILKPAKTFNFACNKDGSKLLVGNALYDFKQIKAKSLGPDFPDDENIQDIRFLNKSLIYSLRDKECVSYHNYNLFNYSSKELIKPDNNNSGSFAVAEDAGLIIDTSGSVFDYNGNKIHSLLPKKNQQFLTVSSSSDGSTIAFGGHSQAEIFRKEKGSFSKSSIPSDYELGLYPDFASVSHDGKSVMFAGNHRGGGEALYFDENANTKYLPFNEFSKEYNTPRSLLSAIPISRNRALLFSFSSFDIVDIDSKSSLSSWDSGERDIDTWSHAYFFAYPYRWVVNLFTNRIYYYRRNGFVDIIDISQISTPKIIASLYFDASSSSVLVTPDNYYSGSGGLFKHIHFVSKDHNIYPSEQFDLRLNRPDIVLKRFGAPAEAVAIAKQLRDKRLRRMNVTEEMLQPDFHVPEVKIDSEVPTTCDADYVNLSIKASDTRYSLDRLRIYVNNVPINGRDGELLRESKFQSLERTIKINLAAGRNKIQVSVLNSAGAESMYANAEVNCTASRPKPTLYAVAMGVSEYSNPEWNLKYAAKDAKDILDRIRLNSTSSFGEVKELLITDREVTKEILPKIKEFLSQAKIDDTVLIFVAGHGLLDSKYDYYFGTSDIDFENPSVKGIAFEEFDDLLAEMPSLRKSLLIDTCHAGELDEDEKKALAASQSAPSDQLIAMHPVGARGMSVKPIEGARGKSEWYDRLQGLFVDLRRGSGSTILSSSAGAEYALESSEQKNGLFTYAVLEALDGKEGSDSNKDGAVTMSELAEYVKKRVSTLTNSKQSPNVRRVNLECDFVLTKKSVESNPELPEKKATEVQPIKEGKIVDTYTCVITNKDRRNNSGIRLEDPVLILMQDRANVHKFGNPEKDSVDNFFSDATHRARIRSYIERGSFPANLQNAMKKDEAAGLQVSVLQDQNGKFSLQVSSAEVANKQQIAPQIKASLEQFEFIDSESNFRVGPGASYAIKYKPLKGTVGTLIQKNGQWIRIQLENGDSGWTHQQNLRIIR
jgi:uncharacterized protein YecT (DUF1311 family)